MIENKVLLTEVFAIDKYVCQLRGHFHQYPEIAAKEFGTSEFLRTEIKKLGLQPEMVDETGFIVQFDTGRVGKTIALRADMDALQLHESSDNLVGSKKWVSKNSDCCHACGHDGHMAILLGAMKILVGFKNQLSGKIIFIFEQGEESNTGILATIKAIENLGIQAIYGTHLTSFMNSGEISADEGPIMAGAAIIAFDVKGKGGHGSRPDLSINPIFATAQVLTGISSAWNNQLDVEETVTLGITQLHGGNAYNIIPDSCYVGGSLRFFNLETGNHAIEVLKNVAINTAKAHNCEIINLENTKMMLEPVINDPTLSEIARNGVFDLLPGHLVKGTKWYASESFSRYSHVAPSCFVFLGIKNEFVGSGAEHHNSKFDLDEGALKFGVAATVKFAIDFLNS